MSTVVVESGVDIKRSPADVSDYCSDHSHEPEWNPMMTHIQQLTPGPIGVGTRYRAQFVTGPPMVIECVRYELPSAWAMMGESPRLTARFGGHVQPTQDGAHLDMRMEIDLHGALRLATPLLHRREQTLFRRDLDTIKARLEGAAGPILEAGRGGNTMIRRQLLGSAVLDVLTALPLFATAPLYRRWHLRWGATDAEVRASMPGDELVPQASFNATRAITINAPPEQVWPWIVQMGYRRAGWYTYALLDNAGYESADSVLPAYQHPTISDWVPMSRRVNATTAFKVQGFERNQWLLWAKPDSSWAWTLTAVGPGRTRLIARLKQRYRRNSPGLALVTLLLLECGDFAMIRRSLNGIKARAERASARGMRPATA